MKKINLILLCFFVGGILSCGEPEVNCGEIWLDQVGDARSDYETAVNDCLTNPFSDDEQDAQCLRDKAMQFGKDVSQAEHDKKCCTGEIDCNNEI